jgi:hypothetical protein
MNYSLGNMLGNGMLGGLDADAKAYIAAVTATGTSVSGTQKAAINNFYKTSKLDGDYTSLKRLYLPIWASASANAIDMIGLTSGTWNGGVTHAAGYVQGDGTTGYLNTLVSPTTLGLTTSSGSIGALIYQADSRPPSGTSVFLMGSNSGLNAGSVSIAHAAFGTVYGNIGVASFTTSASTEGLFVVNRTETNAITMSTRRTAGFAEVSGTSVATSITTAQTYILARRNSISASGFTNARVGLAFIGTEFALGKPTTVTEHLKTLWEGCTGLVLP